MRIRSGIGSGWGRWAYIQRCGDRDGRRPGVRRKLWAQYVGIGLGKGKGQESDYIRRGKAYVVVL